MPLSGALVGKSIVYNFLEDAYGPAGNFDVMAAEMTIISADGRVTTLVGPGTLGSIASSTYGCGAVNASTAWPVTCITEVASSATNTTENTVAPVSNTHFFLSDPLGTAQMELSSGGWPVWQGQFLPFGGEIDTQATTNHYKFTGKERDTESGLDYFGARYYSSNMGRWMSPDWAPSPVPIPFGDPSHPQTLNLYGYAGNNPLSNIDIDGHSTDCDNSGDKSVVCVVTTVLDKIEGWLSGSGSSNSLPPGTAQAAPTNDFPPVLMSSHILSGNVGLGYGGTMAFGVGLPKGDSALMAGQVNVDAMNDNNGSALAESYGGTFPIRGVPTDPTSWGAGLYAGTSAHVTFGNGSLADVRGPFHTTNFNLAWTVEIGGFSYSYSGNTWQVTVSLPATGPAGGLS